MSQTAATLPHKLSLSDLANMYSVLNQRAKMRIRNAFNRHFNLSETDTTFTRLMDGRLMLCIDEYMFLVEHIETSYNFYVWAKTQRMRRANV